ncbi:MAG: aldose 1-epimerase family protein [Actinomycetota bacterium]
MPAALPPPPSGAQHELRHGDHVAVVTEVGATLRHYSVGDLEVIDGFDVDASSPDGRGQVLAPWPNRLDAGRYRFGDRDAQAALDEPDRRNAIHGLVRWLPWSARSRTDATIDLECILHPQPGYPWQIELRVGYELDGVGLTTTARVRNDSNVPAPFGIGFHPYLSVGTEIDRATILVPARRRLLSDDRGLPVGEERTADTDLDFTDHRLVGSVRLDTGFTDLVRGTDDLARAEVTAPDGGRTATLWADPWFRYLMVYTGDTVDPPTRRRCAVAIEPMTCPPNALRTGKDLTVLEPGRVAGGQWGVIPSWR